MRRQAPAAARNRQPILDVLQPHLPARGLVLEVASGSGEHTAHFAQALPDLTFQPSDPDAVARASIDDWTAMLGLANVRPALELDAAAEAWPIIEADAIACINMIHISPWDSAVGLVQGPRACCRGMARSFFTARIFVTVSRRRGATSRSTVTFGRAIRTGAYEPWKRSWRSLRRTALRRRSSPKCRPTICHWSSGAVRTANPRSRDGRPCDAAARASSAS